MSDEQSEQNRSEDATPFKLQRARQKGTVARGMDLGFLTGTAALTGYLWMAGEGFGQRFGQILRNAFVAAPNVAAAPSEILAVTGLVLGAAAAPVMLMVGAVFLVVLVFEVAQTGPVFSTEPLRMDFNRLNPATGFKRVFSVRMLIETGKNILKMIVYSVVAYVAIRAAFSEATPTIVDARSLTGALERSSLKLMLMAIVAALVFAALDQFIVRREFRKKMRMSRRELKRETRDREGEPRQKQKRKALHREFAASSQSLRGIRGSDVLITNPTHFAVALRYDPATMEAPLIVSRGAHQFALRLRRLAFLYGVTIVQNAPLAQALYRCELNGPVPESLYQPVADIYRALREPSATSAPDAAHV